MINNDTLRRLRYALKLNDAKVQATFKLVGVEIPPYHLANIMCKEDEEGFVPCPNDTLVAFLDGLIIHHRGAQEGREPQPWPKGQYLPNNEILRKIRIALKLTDEDIIVMMALAGFKVSKPELSALFRKEGHRNYKECGDQFLRNFITGLTIRNRDEAKPDKTALASDREGDQKKAGKTLNKTSGKTIDPWRKNRGNKR